MKLEMHIIQNFQPSNLNRDDSGLPKDCEFGGYRRARISSQCIKRSIRKSEAFGDRVEIGFRTLRAADIAKSVIMEEFGKDEKIASIIAKTVFELITKKTIEDKTPYLLYTDRNEISLILKYFFEQYDELSEQLTVFTNENSTKTDIKSAKESIIKAVQKSLDEYLKVHKHRIDSIDIALFGRMLADQPSMKIDAACQVAHAISTNRVTMDFDYFTAVDDLNTEEEQGAGMIGNLGFNSSCFYRYAVIDTDQLLKNIGNKKELAVSGIIGFIEGAIQAIPTGKQNTFAAHNPPALVLLTIRDKGMPISLANAFEVPASPKSDKGLSEVSIEMMLDYFNDIANNYALEFDYKSIFANSNKYDLDGLASSKAGNYHTFISGIENYLTEKL